MTWIKICGITNLQDAMDAASLGVEALGFIFARSPRRITPLAAKEIIRSLPPPVLKVGVFVDEERAEVRRIADGCGLNALQFHGQEPPEYCQEFLLPVIKTIAARSLDRLRDVEKYPSVAILLDTWSADRAGGTGKTFPWEWAKEAQGKRDIILSGGLNPASVYQAIKEVRPAGVDVCSGVEQIPGKKDLLKMIDFVKEVRRADASTR